MKSILLVFVFVITSYSNEINNIRQLYLLAHTSQSQCDVFGKELADIKDRRCMLIKGYQACFYFIKCKFVDNPIDKLMYFNKGKDLLEFAIIQEPKSVELKFLRYSIQKNLPRFLLYHSSLEKDFNFVNQNIQAVNDKEVRLFIKNSLKSLSQ